MVLWISYSAAEDCSHIPALYLYLLVHQQLSSVQRENQEQESLFLSFQILFSACCILTAYGSVVVEKEE